MVNSLKVYCDAGIKNKVSLLENVVMPKQEFGSISKKKIDNINMFFDDVNVDCCINNGIRFNRISFDNINVKGVSNILDGSIPYKFGIKKTYVATIDKSVINGVTKFYEMFQNNNNEDNKLVFDASNETRLQSAMNMEFVKPGTDTKPEELNNIENNSLEATTVSNVSTQPLKKGSVNIFWICIVSSLLITVGTFLTLMGVIKF